MSARYYHKVINPQLGSLSQYLEADTNYELVKIVPYTAYETVLVFIEHTDDEVSPTQPQPNITTEE